MGSQKRGQSAAGSTGHAEDLSRIAYKNGFLYEQKYRGCAQCAIAAVQDTLQIPDKSVFKAASALSAGGALLCDGMCGGYSGGILAMGSVFGRRRHKFDDDSDYKHSSYRMAKRLHEKFIAEYGSVICREIHQKLFGETYDLWSQPSKEKFDRDGAHTSKCTDVVGKASSWAVEIILGEAAGLGLDLTAVRKLSEDI